MSKKSLIIIVVLILLIIVTIVLYLVLRNKEEDNLDYFNITNNAINTTIKVGLPKEKGFETKAIGTQGNMTEISNEELKIKILAGLYDRTVEAYDEHEEMVKDAVGFKDIKINDFEGFEYNTSNTSKVMVLILGETETGIKKIYELELLLYSDDEKTIDEVIALEEMQILLKSVKIIDFVPNEPIKQVEEPEENIEENQNLVEETIKENQDSVVEGEEPIN